MEHVQDAHKPATRSAAESVQSANGSVMPVVQRAENNTGLPDNLKTGIERLSGYSMDDVKVHYNSAQPAQLQAHAYAQGTDIHLAPGQEKHLPHEAWHVVQQKQGRVKTTMQLKGKVNVNDDAGLEQEADAMGHKALSGADTPIQQVGNKGSVPAGSILQRVALAKDKLNVVGEEHTESGDRREIEKTFTAKETQSANYWQEGAFTRLDGERGDPGGMRFLQLWGFAEKDGLANHLTNDACTLLGLKGQLETAKGQLFGTGLVQGIMLISTHILSRGWKGEIQRIRPDEPYGNAIRAMKPLLEQHGSPIIEMLAQKSQNIKQYYQTQNPLWNDPESNDEDEDLLDEEMGHEEDDQAIRNEGDLNRELNLILAHAQGLLQALQAYQAIKVTHDFTTSEDITEKRSREMDKAANEKYNELGVWKIGNAHQKDMQRFRNRKYYNLLSRENFNSLLIGFEKKLGAFIGASSGAIIGGVIGGPVGAFLGALAGGIFGAIAGHYIGKKRKKVKDFKTT